MLTSGPPTFFVHVITPDDLVGTSIDLDHLKNTQHSLKITPELQKIQKELHLFTKESEINTDAILFHSFLRKPKV